MITERGAFGYKKRSSKLIGQSKTAGKPESLPAVNVAGLPASGGLEGEKQTGILSGWRLRRFLL
jgi:hypothetical protein